MRFLIVTAVSIAACTRGPDTRTHDTSLSAAIADTSTIANAGSVQPVVHYAPTPPDLLAAACDHKTDSDSIAPPGHETAHQFLGILRTDASANADPRQNVHFASLERILGFVSDSGLTFVDVNTIGDVGSTEAGELTTTNTDTIEHVTLDSMRTRLQSQRGSLYENLQSLAKEYDSGDAGLGHARYCPLPDGFVLLLGALPDYSLAFRRQGGRLRLTRFAALELAAD